MTEEGIGAKPTALNRSIAAQRGAVTIGVIGDGSAPPPEIETAPE
jgi:hypothetical protein